VFWGFSVWRFTIAEFLNGLARRPTTPGGSSIPFRVGRVCAGVLAGILYRRCAALCRRWRSALRLGRSLVIGLFIVT
jgi:hypothetical protein